MRAGLLISSAPLRRFCPAAAFATAFLTAALWSAPASGKAGKASASGDWLGSTIDDVQKWSRSMNGALTLRSSVSIPTSVPLASGTYAIDPYFNYTPAGNLFNINNPLLNLAASYSFSPLSGIQWTLGLNATPDQAQVNPDANSSTVLGYFTQGSFDFGDDFKLVVRYTQGWSWSYTSLINTYGFPFNPVNSLDELRTIQKGSSLQDSTSFSITFLKQKTLQLEPQFSTIWTVIRRDIPWDRLAGLTPADQYTLLVNNHTVDNLTGNVSMGLSYRPIDELSFGANLTLNPTIAKNASIATMTVDASALNSFIEWRPSTYTTVKVEYNTVLQTLAFVDPYVTWIPTKDYLNSWNWQQYNVYAQAKRNINHVINLSLQLR